MPPDEQSTTSIPSALSSVAKATEILDRPADIDAVDRRDADEHRQMVGPLFAHDRGDAERQAHPVLARTAILRRSGCSPVAREEEVHQIAVRAVQFDDVVAGRLRALECATEVLHHAFDLLAGQHVGSRPAVVERNAAGSGDLPRSFSAGVDIGLPERPAAFPWTLGRTFPAAVRDLYCGLRIELVDQRGEFWRGPPSGASFQIPRHP